MTHRTSPTRGSGALHLVGPGKDCFVRSSIVTPMLYQRYYIVCIEFFYVDHCNYYKDVFLCEYILLTYLRRNILFINCFYSSEPEGNTVWYKTSEPDQGWRRTTQQRVSGTESDWTVASLADRRTHDNRIGKPDAHLSPIRSPNNFPVRLAAYHLVYTNFLLFSTLTS